MPKKAKQKERTQIRAMLICPHLDLFQLNLMLYVELLIIILLIIFKFVNLIFIY